jgi:hypothetical protein
MIPRLTSFVIVLLLTALSAHAQSPEQVFQKGNGFYQQGNYASAIECYE